MVVGRVFLFRNCWTRAMSLWPQHVNLQKRRFASFCPAFHSKSPGIIYKSLMVSETTDIALVFFNSSAMFSPNTAPERRLAGKLQRKSVDAASVFTCGHRAILFFATSKSNVQSFVSPNSSERFATIRFDVLGCISAAWSYRLWKFQEPTLNST